MSTWKRAELLPADIAEILTLSPDSKDAPTIVRAEVGSVEELIDLARAKSEEGTPREVQAIINGLQVARFMGRWVWDTRAVV